ncbi:MAG TPA: glucose-6-phosphate dehydrogenase assembly protein OpcA [Thermoanaerobaculia bacterium]|nr:glucose-6-phosphate dehydrogenase assembly protein OpcA [Thermoanaerobaculia bacterium]
MAKALSGDDIPVNALTIEKRLADIWREEGESEEGAVTRAALWNVIAHTWDASQHAFATEVLGRASAAVPQRTIVIRADPHAAAELSSWISANCHMMGGGRQVCSEEVAIVASGERVHHVPPLVASLLLPDMPVAVWWVGDLPDDQHEYAQTLLDPADRLIVDSSQFNSAADFALVSRIAEKTITAPADLNWARIDEWRAATAALFDPPPMRARLQQIRNVRVLSGGDAKLGDLSEAVLYVSWLRAQTERETAFDFTGGESEAGINAVEIHFDDGSIETLRGDREKGVVIASDWVARGRTRALEDLIVRLLKRPEADRVYIKALRLAREVASSLSRA